MRLDSCPYCAGPLSDDSARPDGRTADHVFWEALGGRATIDACRQCNSRIGSDIEGRLVSGNELFARRLRGEVAGEGDATSLAGRVVEIDLDTGAARNLRPVTTRDIGHERHFRVEGSPGQVEQLLRQGLGRLGGWDDRAITERVAGAPRSRWPSVDVEVRHDVALGRRLAAKMLLGAGMLADPDFGESTLAASLRDVLWHRVSPFRLLGPGAVRSYAQILAELPGIAPVVQLNRQGSIATAVFLPVPRQAVTGVIVRVGHVPIGLSGFLVGGTWPRAGELAAVVEDRVGGATSRFVTDEVHVWLSGR